MAGLVDTNVLVYRFDRRFPDKERVATDVLRRGILDDTVRVPHQALVEFVAAVTRPTVDGPLLSPEDARREAEEMLSSSRSSILPRGCVPPVGRAFRLVVTGGAEASYHGRACVTAALTAT